jgi:SAM-dependent methyltransferase
MKSFEEQYYEAPSFWQAGAVLTGRMNDLVAMLPSGTRSLLDVGCGNGAWGHYLIEARPEIEVTGVDRSEAALAHVRFKKQQAAIDALPFEDCSFDAVTCLQVIEHLHAPVAEVALDQLARLARNVLIVEVPFDEDIAANRTTCPRCTTTFNIDLHFDRFGEKRLKSLFDSRGFEFGGWIFPERKERLWLIDDAYTALTSLRAKRPEFVSPICPLCGYTEGDRTAISLTPETMSGSPKAGLRRALSSLKHFWPKVEARGYSVACLYLRV